MLTTIFAMIYLTYFSFPFFIPSSFLYPTDGTSLSPALIAPQPSLQAYAILSFFFLLLFSAWVYLIRDLIKQVSLYFRKKRI